MSRTFRRKGYEHTISHRPGGKIAGYYTIQEYYWAVMAKKDRKWPIPEEERYRAPTREEYFNRYWSIHGDNHRNSWSPARYYRHSRMVENRSINKQEIYRWIQSNGEYEPLTEANPRSCLWDWS